jgi:hypothetical protein
LYSDKGKPNPVFPGVSIRLTNESAMKTHSVVISSSD